MDRVEVGEKFGIMPKTLRFQRRELGPSLRSYKKKGEDEEELVHKYDPALIKKPRDILKRFEVPSSEQQAALKEGWINNLRMRLGLWFLKKGLSFWLSSRETITVENSVFSKDLYLAECREVWNERISRGTKYLRQQQRPEPKVLYLHTEEGQDG